MRKSNLFILCFPLSMAIISLTIIPSCKVEITSDPIIEVDFVYYNISQYDIVMKLYNSNQELLKDYIIYPNENLSLKLKGMGGSTPFNFDAPIGKPDSVYITFSNLRYVSYSSNYSQSNILFDYAYNCNEDSDSTRTCGWIFSNQDFENARDIISCN